MCHMQGCLAGTGFDQSSRSHVLAIDFHHFHHFRSSPQPDPPHKHLGSSGVKPGTFLNTMKHSPRLEVVTVTWALGAVVVMSMSGVLEQALSQVYPSLPNALCVQRSIAMSARLVPREHPLVCICKSSLSISRRLFS